MDNPKKVALYCCAITTFIAVGIFVLISFSSLSATEYGLDYAYITKTIDS